VTTFANNVGFQECPGKQDMSDAASDCSMLRARLPRPPRRPGVAGYAWCRWTQWRSWPTGHHAER
jgi:hypothetical protein